MENNKKLSPKDKSWFAQKKIGLETFLDSLQDILVVVNQNYEILFINQVAVGAQRDQIIGTTVFNYIPEEEHKTVKDNIDKIFKTGEVIKNETKGMGLDGGISWYSSVAAPLKIKNKTEAVVIVSHDITQTKNYTETLLKDILERKIGSFESNEAPDQIFVMSKAGRFIDYRFSKNFVPFVPPEAFLGKTFVDILPQEVAWRANAKLTEAFEKKKPQILEYTLVQNDETLAFEARIHPANENEALVIVRDMTEAMSYREEFLELMKRERKRIGHDLHDGLSQHLTGIAFLAKVLEKKLSEQKLSEAAEVHKIVSLVNDAIDHTRCLAKDLHLVEIETSTLKEVLQELVENTKKFFNVECVLFYDAKAKIVGAENIRHMYRITQEAINNAIKHGAATKIEIEVSKKKESIQLLVRDNGSGFDLDSIKKSGAGLKIMQYRASVIGATLEIARQKKQGTQVVCEFFAAKD